ncbi:MAG: hypothetical protein KH100_15015, partial [Dysgonomonas mossii]|uniref:hypothetical protein n=1 Tax=Dysgonomonas mossii TaxID=163665 RepID=UPI001DB278E0
MRRSVILFAILATLLIPSSCNQRSENKEDNRPDAQIKDTIKNVSINNSDTVLEQTPSHPLHWNLPKKDANFNSEMSYAEGKNYILEPLSPNNYVEDTYYTNNHNTTNNGYSNYPNDSYNNYPIEYEYNQYYYDNYYNYYPSYTDNYFYWHYDNSYNWYYDYDMTPPIWNNRPDKPDRPKRPSRPHESNRPQLPHRPNPDRYPDRNPINRPERPESSRPTERPRPEISERPTAPSIRPLPESVSGKENINTERERREAESRRQREVQERQEQERRESESRRQREAQERQEQERRETESRRQREAQERQEQERR